MSSSRDPPRWRRTAAKWRPLDARLDPHRRDRERLTALSRRHSVAWVGTDLEAALANLDDATVFDAATTQMRAALLRKAIAAGKAMYRDWWDEGPRPRAVDHAGAPRDRLLTARSLDVFLDALNAFLQG